MNASQQNTHYRHFRDMLLNKDYTLCGVVNTKGNLMVGLAIRNPKDPFIKAIGRETAFAHAHTNPVVELVLQEGQYSGHLFHEFANNFTPNNTFKSRINLGENVIEYN